MLSTGMLRKIDTLGRIVIPKEIRRSLKIDSGDDLEMFVEGESLVLKKYQAIDKYAEIAKTYCVTLYDNIHTNIFICSKEKTVAAYGGAAEGEISQDLLEIISGGAFVHTTEGGAMIPLLGGDDPAKFACQCIAPINCMGDILGAIVAYSPKRPDALKDKDITLIKSAALLLCGQL